PPPASAEPHCATHCTSGWHAWFWMHAAAAALKQSPASLSARHALQFVLAACPLQRLFLHVWLVLQRPGVVHAHVVSAAKKIAAASGLFCTQQPRQLGPGAQPVSMPASP